MVDYKRVYEDARSNALDENADTNPEVEFLIQELKDLESQVDWWGGVHYSCLADFVSATYRLDNAIHFQFGEDGIIVSHGDTTSEKRERTTQIGTYDNYQEAVIGMVEWFGAIHA